MPQSTTTGKVLVEICTHLWDWEEVQLPYFEILFLVYLQGLLHEIKEANWIKIRTFCSVLCAVVTLEISGKKGQEMFSLLYVCTIQLTHPVDTIYIVGTLDLRSFWSAAQYVQIVGTHSTAGVSLKMSFSSVRCSTWYFSLCSSRAEKSKGRHSIFFLPGKLQKSFASQSSQTDSFLSLSLSHRSEKSEVSVLQKKLKK